MNATMIAMSTRGHMRLVVFASFVLLGSFLSFITTSQSSQAYLDHIVTAITPRSRLVPFKLTPLPLGSIEPQGWLRDQMQLMADGLAGHEYDFYDYVAESSWLGGHKEYSGLHEGFPYWLNGLVPLAFGLHDQRLKQQVHDAVQYVLDHQHEDGWLGPEVGPERLIWARFPLCLGLMQLAEADALWTDRIVDALHSFNALLNSMLLDGGIGYIMHKNGDWRFEDFAWGRVRSADMIITLQWLYEHHPKNSSATLMQNMKLLHDYGLKWENWYTSKYFARGMHLDLYTLPENETKPYYHYQHGVNVAQGLKSPAVIQRFTHKKGLTQTAKNAVNWTMRYHGAASGTIIADERIVGLSPGSGSELCTSVELMYSLAYLYHATGDVEYADKAEVAAFNSLPAMFTPDYWAHLYVQTANQASAKKYIHSPFYNTNRWSQTFGLEPHYPCCTTNHPQGWPKFASHSFARVSRDGIAHTLLSPGKVKTTLASGKIAVEAITAYPFSDEIRYEISTDAAASFYVRVPSWADKKSLLIVNDGPALDVEPDRTTGLHKIALQPGSTSIQYRLETKIRIEARPNSTVSFFRGSLLYAFEVEATKTSTSPRQWDAEHNTFKNVPAECKDWQYYNASMWNIAVKPDTAQWHPSSFPNLKDLSNPVFDSGTNTGFITVQACECNWPTIDDGIPGTPPSGGVKCMANNTFTVKLIPYGGAKLHMAELPIIST